MASEIAPITMKRPTKIIRPKTKKGLAANKEVPGAGVASASSYEVLASPKQTPEHLSEQPLKYDEIKPYCDPDLFVKRQIKRRLSIPFYKITKTTNVSHLLRTELSKTVEGRCSIEGYICPNSISICSHSCGTLAAANILFDVTADCLICFPDENSVIKCVAKTITQAGIRAGARSLEDGHVSPIEVFLSRDMHSSSRDLFSRIEEADILTVKIIGRRFVLHDTHVTIIAMVLDVEKQ
jgi:hypothetical protein